MKDDGYIQILPDMTESDGFFIAAFIKQQDGDILTEDKIDIKSLNFTELQKLLEEMGEKKFRAKQLYEWIHKRLVLSFDEMTNLSKDMRKNLMKAVRQKVQE